MTDKDNSLPPNYPRGYKENATLADGTRVFLRPIRPDDAPRLQETFRRLSPQTVYYRFLQTFKELSDQQAKELAHVDYQTRMAIVASIMEDGKESIIGVARYGCLVPDHPELAEAAIVVRDDFQSRGLGTLIMDRLVRYAREHGIEAFLGYIHTSNFRIMHFIEKGGLPVHKQMVEPGTFEVRVLLKGYSGVNSATALHDDHSN